MNTTTPRYTVTVPKVRTRLEHAARYPAQLPDEQLTMERYSNDGTGLVESLARGQSHCGCKEAVGYCQRSGGGTTRPG